MGGLEMVMTAEREVGAACVGLSTAYLIASLTWTEYSNKI